MGKTVTTEFAYFSPGKTRNPHHLDHTPGGSSQGSAAAVADFMVPFAIGSQTAASVIRPAAFCGVIGYKASAGQFPLNGALTLSYSMDSLGFFVRSLEDLRLLRNVLLGVSASAALLKPRKVGLVKMPYWSELDSESQSAIETAGSDLAESGIEIKEVQVDGREGVNLVDAHQTVMAFEVSRSRAEEYENHRNKLSDQFTQLVESGHQIGYQAYQQALKQRDSANHRLRTEFGDCDLFLTASAPGEAPKGLSSTGDPKFSRGWNLIGGPSVTLPAGKGRTQLPLGVQLVGHLHKDDDLIAHASWIQQNMQLGTSN
jgi:amidase